MDNEDIASTNPYTPPKAEESTPLPPRAGSFTVGPERRFVQIYWSYWSGLEVYTVDGSVVLRTKNYQVRGVREFNVGRHKVIIKLDFLPSWKIFLRPWEWIAEATIDGEPVVEDVTAELRARFRPLMVSLRYSILGLFLLLGILLVICFTLWCVLLIWSDSIL